MRKNIFCTKVSYKQTYNKIDLEASLTDVSEDYVQAKVRNLALQTLRDMMKKGNLLQYKSQAYLFIDIKFKTYNIICSK